jgi:hypothetical protein
MKMWNVMLRKDGTVEKGHFDVLERFVPVSKLLTYWASNHKKNRHNDFQHGVQEGAFTP